MINQPQQHESLLKQSFDLTVLGVILTIIITLVETKITGQSVIIICGFLACSYLWKLISPTSITNQHKWWQVFSFAMIGAFSWWLIYAAENTRAGWYRFNILQTRVESLVAEAPAYIILADDDGYITETSKNIQTLTGYTREELVNKNLTILMRDAPASRHLLSYHKAADQLKKEHKIKDTGWMLQGLVVVGVKHKDGHIVPVKAYAGGIRWSTDIQFKGDIDMFAVLVPATLEQAKGEKSTVKDNPSEAIKVAPEPPSVKTTPE